MKADVTNRDRTRLSLAPESCVIYNIINWRKQWTPDVVIYKTEDGGLTWQDYYKADSYPRLIIYDQKEYLLGSGILKIKEPDSSEWKTIRTNVKAPLLLSISKSDPQNLYIIDSSTLYISEDRGFSWASIKLPGRVHMADMEVNGTSQIIYLLVNSNIVGRSDQIYKSEDGGKNWTDVSPKSKEFDEEKNTLKVNYIGNMGENTTCTMNHTDPNTVFLGTKGRGIYKTTNGGKTWEFRSEGLEGNGVELKDISINCLAIDSKNQNIVFAGTNKGVFRSLDKGSTWQPFNNGLPASERDIVTVNVNNSTPQLIVLQTINGNAWRLMDSSSMSALKKKWETLW
jgi:photosystem II stability/assembly factor-like uncharacterized protein